MSCPSSNIDSASIESFVSPWISSKWRYLSDCDGWRELFSIFYNPIRMVDQQLFSFSLSELVSNWSNIDCVDEKRILPSRSNLPFWNLRIETDRHHNDNECSNKSIYLYSNNSIRSNDKSSSIGNISDHARRRTRSSSQSWSLFSRWRWKSVQRRGLDLSILLSHYGVSNFPTLQGILLSIDDSHLDPSTPPCLNNRSGRGERKESFF